MQPTFLETGKKTFYTLWILAIVYILIECIRNPTAISQNSIKDFIESYNNEMMLVYVIVSLVRGIFLIPSTPFVIGGGLLFPDRLHIVLLISMAGVMASATALYYFSDLLGFSEYLEKKYPNDIVKWKRRLSSPKAIIFVLVWSFFPLVPTDLICYIAGIVKMPYKHMFMGVFFGELVIVTFYVYFGANI